MVVFLFAVIAIIFIASASCQEPIKEFNSYSKLDKAGIIFNVILSIAYLSLYVISNIIFAVSDKSYNNQVQGIQAVVFQVTEFIVPLICIISIALSVKFRKIGKSMAAFYVQFVPVVIIPVKWFFLG